MARTEVTTYTCDACGRDVGTTQPATMRLSVPGPYDAVSEYPLDICPDCLAMVVRAVDLPIS